MARPKNTEQTDNTTRPASPEEAATGFVTGSVPALLTPGQNEPGYVAPADTDTPIQADAGIPEIVTDADLPEGNPDITAASTEANDKIPTLPQGIEPVTEESTAFHRGDKVANTAFAREQAAHIRETRETIAGSNAFDELIHDIAGATPKDLAISPDHPLAANVRDIVTFGDSDTWQLLCKASSRSQGWMKTTKAMDLNGMGVLVQTETQQRNGDNSYALSQATVQVMGVRIQDVTDPDGKLTGRILVRTH